MLTEYSKWLVDHMSSGGDYVDFRTYCLERGLSYEVTVRTPVIAPQKGVVQIGPTCCGGGKIR